MSFANQLEQLINDQKAYLRNETPTAELAIEKIITVAAILSRTPDSVQAQGAMLLALLELGVATKVPFGELLRSARNVFEARAANSFEVLSGTSVNPLPDLSTMGVSDDQGRRIGKGTGASITKVNTDLNQDDRQR